MATNKPDKETKYPIHFDPSIPYQVNIIYPKKGKIESFPQTLTVYKYKKNLNNNTLNPEEIAKNLNFKNEPEKIETINENITAWSEKGQTLFYYEKQGSIEYGIDILFTEGIFNTKGPVLDNSIKTVDEFLTKNKLNSTNLKPNDKQVNYYQFGPQGLKEVEVWADAVAINIPYTYTLNSYPIQTSNPKNTPISFLLNTEGKILELNYHPYKDNLEEFQIVKTKTENEVNNDLNKRKAALVYIDDKEQLPEAFDQKTLNVLEIKIKKTSLAYYESDEVRELLQPVFVFESECVIKNMGTLNCLLMLPAVKL